jgi:alkyl sulfatase BDS1-like metallo-beta-lactamase superfamily hydrolase
VYELTEVGHLLDPVLISLATFGSRLALPSATAEMSIDAFVLALRTTFDAEAARDLDAAYELRIDHDVFHASIRRGHFGIARGTSSRPDATLTGSVAALRAVVFGGRPLAEALRTGDVQADGDLDATQRFVIVFPRPQPYAS